ncbi:meiotically up-regulated 24 protein [Schizosaccharomyces osmophilus]|uniref:Meiotically up-regulated 24 protein n=1 Tax=Schizosaccharomyces osmophilus TaxID=2545709 RepID=A0AAF0AXB7_9SCHI|nr:meiotically up-regulated 24 protein [Schizosaccharomyces osmophilus]WBW73925.1 meiotically up-regulated 24 protein [Schizosaccharomyces osmophilus]
MQQSSQTLSASNKVLTNHPAIGHVFSPMTYRNPLLPSVFTNIPMGAMQAHMNQNNRNLPYALPKAFPYQKGTTEQAGILANFRMGNITQRPPHPRPVTDTNKTNGEELGNFQVLPYGYWDYRAVLIHNMPAYYNISEFMNLGRFGTLERVVPIYERNQLFLNFLSAADAFDFYNAVRHTDFTFKNQRLIVSTIDIMPLEPSIMEACQQDFVSRNVQITGLPSNFDEAAFFQHVCSLGKAELISVCKNTDSIYVHYLSITDALHCIDSLQSHPYYRNLKSCCFYERCDRYYALDFHVEKTVPSSAFMKPEGVSNKNMLKESSIQNRYTNSFKKSTVHNPVTQLEHKSNANSPPSLSKNVLSENNVTTDTTNNKQCSQPDNVTDADSAPMTESKKFHSKDHTSLKELSNELFPDLESSHQKDSKTLSSEQNISISVPGRHSKTAALQNVTNSSSFASHSHKSKFIEPTNKLTSPINSPVGIGNGDKYASLHLLNDIECPQDGISPNSNNQNITNSTDYDQANEGFSANPEPDVNMNCITQDKDKAISNEDKDNLPKDSTATSNSNSSCEEFSFSNENSRKTTENGFSSVSSSPIDTYTPIKTHFENDITNQSPSTFECFYNTDSPTPLPAKHSDEDSINDFRYLPRLTTELSSSKNSSVLTSPTLVGSPLDTPMKSFADFSEFTALDIMSKPSTDNYLALDLDPCYKNRTLFLSKIHKATKQFEISKLFQGFPIEEVRHFSKKKICFVTFLESYDAKIFLDAHQKQPAYLHGRPVRLEWAKSDNPFTDKLLYAISKGARRSISFETNRLSIPRCELVSIFKKFGDIESFHFSKKTNSGSITYNNIYSAMEVMENLQSHSIFQNATIDFTQEDRHDLLNSRYDKHSSLQGEKNNKFTKGFSIPALQSLSSCFPIHDFNSPLQTKGTDFRPTNCAIISTKA